MDDPKTTVLATVGNFSAVLDYYRSGAPHAITLWNNAHDDHVILRVDLDAVSSWGFCNTAPIMQLPEGERAAAVECLANALGKQYGGSNILSIPAELVKIFEANGIHLSPQTINGAQYKGLMSAPLGDVAHKIAALAVDRPLSDRYEIVTDRQRLVSMAADISDLILHNVAYAGNERGWHLYTPDAIREGIDQNNIQAIALTDKMTNKPVAFMKSYIKPGVGVYTSSLVAEKAKRVGGFGVWIMHHALVSLSTLAPETPLFLIVGNSRNRDMYGKMGFRSLAQNVPFTLPSGDTLMFGLFPNMDIQRQLHADLRAKSPDTWPLKR